MFAGTVFVLPFNDWQGTFNGAPLPDGTYFYVIQINDSNSVLKGSLDILKSK